MVVARRLQHLTELLRDGRRLSAHFSVNPDTHSEKVKFIVRPSELAGSPGESVLLLAVLEYLVRAEPGLHITDRGHTHSDGTSEACFYIKHPRASRHDPEREADEPRAAEPHGLAAPPADRPRAPEPRPADEDAPDSGNMDTEPVPDCAGPLRALQEDDHELLDVSTGGGEVVDVVLGGGGEVSPPPPPNLAIGDIVVLPPWDQPWCVIAVGYGIYLGEVRIRSLTAPNTYAAGMWVARARCRRLGGTT